MLEQRSDARQVHHLAHGLIHSTKLEHLPAFGHLLSHIHQRELLLKIERRIGKHGANVQLFPLDEKSWTGRRVIERDEKE